LQNFAKHFQYIKMKNKILIAIDGPSASGKGTIAKMLGEKLNLPVLYTGNIYRAIAYNILQNNIDPNDEIRATIAAKSLKFKDLDNPNLNQEIIGQYASIIGTHSDLREATYKFQRDFIENSINGAVIEGRDIGTVICPEADFKFYITASAEVRATRRVAQQNNSSYDVILADLKERDERDQTRVIAPLKPAQDAMIIDSSNLNAQQTMDIILLKINS
jgi:CMP/dCMP kinase